MAEREFIGRLDDTFVFTAHNDVITWSRADGLRKTETNLVDLKDADLFSDGIIIAGLTDYVDELGAGYSAKISRIDIDGDITTLYAGGYETHPFDIYVYHGMSMVTLDDYTIGIYDDWSVAVGV